MLAGTLVYQPGSRSGEIWWVRTWVQDWWTQLGLCAADDCWVFRECSRTYMCNAISPVWLIASSANCLGHVGPFRVLCTSCAISPVWLIACCLPLPGRLESVPILGVDTRAMSKAKMGYKALDASGSHKKCTFLNSTSIVYILSFCVRRDPLGSCGRCRAGGRRK